MPLYDITSSSSGELKRLEQHVLGKQPFMLFVFANWCGHCMSTKPEWEKMCDTMKKENYASNLVRVNEATFQQLRTHPTHILGRIMAKIVQGFPTIVYVNQTPREVVVIDFQGERTSENMYKFLKANDKKYMNAHAKATTKPPIAKKPVAKPSAAKAPTAKKPVAKASVKRSATKKPVTKARSSQAK